MSLNTTINPIHKEMGNFAAPIFMILEAVAATAW